MSVCAISLPQPRLQWRLLPSASLLSEKRRLGNTPGSRRLRFLESLRCRSACLALFLVGLCSMGPLSRAAQAENIALQNPSFRAVFDRATGALREIKGDQWLASFGAPGGRLMAGGFPGGSGKERTASK